ncbi:unnamed protein product [Boreogadus saida]
MFSERWASDGHGGPQSKASGCGLRALGSGADRRTVDKTLKRLEKLHQLSSNPRLALKTARPTCPTWCPRHEGSDAGLGAPTCGRGGGPGAPGGRVEYLRVHAGSCWIRRRAHCCCSKRAATRCTRRRPTADMLSPRLKSCHLDPAYAWNGGSPKHNDDIIILIAFSSL